MYDKIRPGRFHGNPIAPPRSNRETHQRYHFFHGLMFKRVSTTNEGVDIDF